MNPDDITYKIVTEAQETQEEFIFTTILPFCEEVTQKKLNKRDLEQILLAGMKATTSEWISVKEKLPPLKQHVLLSCYGRVVYGRLEDETGNSGYPLFSICDSVGESRPIVLETTAHNEFTTGRITAWRPLPEPYKEDKKLS